MAVSSIFARPRGCSKEKDTFAHCTDLLLLIEDVLIQPAFLGLGWYIAYTYK